MNVFLELDIILLIVLLSTVLGIAFIYVGKNIAIKINLIDYPGTADHKNHENPTPMIGGMVVMTTFIIMISLNLNIIDSAIKGILLSACCIFLFGLIDDYKHLNVKSKLLGQLVAAIILLAFDVKVDFFNSPEFFLKVNPSMAYFLNTSITIFWIIGIVNAFNLIDGIDGLAVGISILSSLFFLIISIGANQPAISLICSIILGVSIPIYYFNVSPAKIFLGDSGSQTLGLLFAAIAIEYNPLNADQSSTWFVPILIFAIPIFDLSLVMFSRLRRGVKIYSASNDHTFHRLQRLGFSKQRSVLTIQGISLLTGMVGFLCINLNFIIANLVFVTFIMIGIITFFLLDK